MYVRGVSEKFKHVAGRCNIRIVFIQNVMLRNSFFENQANKGSPRRWQILSVVSPVHVAEGTLEKQGNH
jgi:hypothetical protein